MATRSTIALEFADGTVGMVYCHWDGYLEHNGKILFEHYQDPFKLRRLIDIGDLSVLDVNIGDKHNFDSRPPNQSTFYGRDRDDVDANARYYKDIEDYKQNHPYEEYEYILRNNGVWYVCDTFGENVYHKLEDELLSIDEDD